MTTQNELYFSSNSDENALVTINGRASIMSQKRFKEKYPSGKIPRADLGYGKTFICRRGCNQNTSTFTEEFNWEDTFQQHEDIEKLQQLIESQTLKTRKAKPKTVPRPAPEIIDRDYTDKENEPETPRKKRKIEPATTPSSRHRKTPVKLRTPTHRRIMTKKALAFTPLGTRMMPDDMIAASPHQQARTTLHVAAVPNSLPGRETEFETVYSHLEAAISAGTGSCIYISGTPGTGKTATVRAVVASLDEAVQAEELDDFIFVEINGMKVTDPHQSYSLLWEALKEQRVSPSHAHQLLEQEFNTPSPRRVPIVVLMDELDQLVTRNQDVMYDFFNWPQLRHSRLIVLAVANTMDLPERTLNNKISSRLGLTRITFPGYTHQQLIKIIESRLEGVQRVPVDKDAIQFASRKVAAVSGDARRALDVCRRAVEIAEQEVADGPEREPGVDVDMDADAENPDKAATGIVTIATIKRAIQEATSTPLAAFLRTMPLASKVFLAALLINLRRTGLQEAVLGEVLDTARRRAAQAGGSGLVEKQLVVLNPDRKKVEYVKGLSSAAVELAAAGVIGLETGRGERPGRVRLGVGEEDVRGALREDEESVGLGFTA